MDGDKHQLNPGEVKPEKKFFPRYMIVREVGEQAMCSAVNWLTEMGYEPAGGVTAHNVEVDDNVVVMRGSRRKTETMLGYVQALWLPMHKALVEVPDFSKDEGPVK